MNNKEKLQKKLKTLNFSIGLGNFAYTPIDETLKKWLRSDNKAIEKDFDELFDKTCNEWYKKELNDNIKKGEFKKILFKSNPSQKEWEEYFFKVVSKQT